MKKGASYKCGSMGSVNIKHAFITLYLCLYSHNPIYNGIYNLQVSTDSKLSYYLANVLYSLS